MEELDEATRTKDRGLESLKAQLSDFVTHDSEDAPRPQSSTPAAARPAAYWLVECVKSNTAIAAGSDFDPSFDDKVGVPQFEFLYPTAGGEFQTALVDSNNRSMRWRIMFDAAEAFTTDVLITGDSFGEIQIKVNNGAYTALTAVTLTTLSFRKGRNLLQVSLGDGVARVMFLARLLSKQNKWVDPNEV